MGRCVRDATASLDATSPSRPLPQTLAPSTQRASWRSSLASRAACSAPTASVARRVVKPSTWLACSVLLHSQSSVSGSRTPGPRNRVIMNAHASVWLLFSYRSRGCVLAERVASTSQSVALHGSVQSWQDVKTALSLAERTLQLRRCRCKHHFPGRFRFLRDLCANGH